MVLRKLEIKIKKFKIKAQTLQYVQREIRRTFSQYGDMNFCPTPKLESKICSSHPYAGIVLNKVEFSS